MRKSTAPAKPDSLKDLAISIVIDGIVAGYILPDGVYGESIDIDTDYGDGEDKLAGFDPEAKAFIRHVLMNEGFGLTAEDIDGIDKESGDE